jgi:hypothetical protein
MADRGVGWIAAQDGIERRQPLAPAFPRAASPGPGEEDEHSQRQIIAELKPICANGLSVQVPHLVALGALVPDRVRDDAPTTIAARGAGRAVPTSPA